jgi:hypothetical protein
MSRSTDGWILRDIDVSVDVFSWPMALLTIRNPKSQAKPTIQTTDWAPPAKSSP